MSSNVVNSLPSIKLKRNFAIIAHVDHGKSTLSDRLLEYCGAISEREKKDQILDNMQLERERGITIKSQTARMYYKAKDGNVYVLNLVDTPGHVDFSYEVSRGLAACDGSILLVDAKDGPQAQTLINTHLAINCGHKLLIVLNKIDLPGANPDAVKAQIEELIGVDTSHAILASAKTGQGIEDVLEGIISSIPAPTASLNENELKALLIDSYYDPYLGIVVLVRIFSGTLKVGMSIKMLSNGSEHKIEKLGVFLPTKTYIDVLTDGDIGFFTASIKHIADCKVGDTITESSNASCVPLKGFSPNMPVVFCGFFPYNSGEFEELRAGLEKLHLNDGSFIFEPDSSSALGVGFRCGFLGLLHMDIIQERLFREFNIEVIATAPSVSYKAYLTDGSVMELRSAADMPDVVKIDRIEEPWIEATIITPNQFLGGILELCTIKRGEQKEILCLNDNRSVVKYYLPMNEIVIDFYDKIKSISKGYASFDYSIYEYREGDLIKLSILVNGELVDALSSIVHKDNALRVGKVMCTSLKDVIPRQTLKIIIQAAIGGKIIARETINPFIKKVTDRKILGKDRKAKLLQKQKVGRKLRQQFLSVDIPPSAFKDVLKNNARNS